MKFITFTPAVLIVASIVLLPSHVSVCLSAQKLRNNQSEIDVTWCEYLLQWTLEAFKFWWTLSLTFNLGSYFCILFWWENCL